MAVSEQLDRPAYSTRLTMLAAAEAEAASTVAPATQAGNQFCRYQYLRGLLVYSNTRAP